MQSLECVELLLFVLLPKMSVPNIKNLGLGNIVNCKLSDDDDCALKMSHFNGSVNKLLGNYGKLHFDMLCKLLNSYFYGSQIWNVNSKGFAKCCRQWNKAAIFFETSVSVPCVAFRATYAQTSYFSEFPHQNAAFLLSNVCQFE